MQFQAFVVATVLASAHALPNVFHSADNREMCWMMCMPESPRECPGNGRAKNVNKGNDSPCWTCCFDQDTDDVPQFIESSKSVAPVAGGENEQWGLCLNLPCMRKDGFNMECPGGTRRHSMGGCESCCIPPSSWNGGGDNRDNDRDGHYDRDDRHQHALTRGEDDDNMERAGICLMICAMSPIQCRNPMQLRKFGECNTCCMPPRNGNGDDNGRDGRESATIEVKVTTKSSSDRHCMKLCYPDESEMRCPMGMEREKFGQCNTCCMENNMEL